jgi:hypothetical protein
MTGKMEARAAAMRNAIAYLNVLPAATRLAIMKVNLESDEQKGVDRPLEGLLDVELIADRMLEYITRP